MGASTEACVIDTSAIVAIRVREPDAEAIAVRLGASPYRIMPPSCIVEFCMLHRLGRGLDNWLAAFIEEYEVTVPPMNAEIAWLAARAAREFGRGTGHPAGLNFGDCMSYAFARQLGAPLLFKGGDFLHTDITPAMVQPS
jgi:ribonuclease VapC